MITSLSAKHRPLVVVFATTLILVGVFLGVSGTNGATDTVSVTATVGQNVSCSTDATTTAFGTLTTGSVTTAGTNASTTYSCNTGTGCTLYIRDANAGLSTSSPAYTINSTTATLVAGTEGYGVNATTTSVGTGTVSLNSTYGPTKWNSNQVGALAASNTWLSSSTVGQVAAREVLVQHRAAISASTQAATYTDTITYECLAN